MKTGGELSKGGSVDEEPRKLWINQYKVKPFLKELKIDKQGKFQRQLKEDKDTDKRFEKQIYLNKGGSRLDMPPESESEVRRTLVRKTPAVGLSASNDYKIQNASTTVSMSTYNQSRQSNNTKLSGSPPVAGMRHTNPFKSLIDTSKRTPPLDLESVSSTPINTGFRATTKDRFRNLPELDLHPKERLSTPSHWAAAGPRRTDGKVAHSVGSHIRQLPGSSRGGSLGESPDSKLVSMVATASKLKDVRNTPIKGKVDGGSKWGTAPQPLPLMPSPLLRSTLTKTSPAGGWLSADKKSTGWGSNLSPSERATLLALYGIVMPRSEAPEKDSRPVKFYVGKGNNQRLISEMLARRDRLTSIGTSSNAQLTWTQLELKEFQRTSLYSVAKLHLDDIKSNSEYRYLEISDSSKLTSNLLRLRLFHLSDPHLLKEMVDYCFNKSYMHMLPSEQLVISNSIKGTIFIGRKSLLTEIIFNYYSRTNQDPFRLIPRTYVMKMSNYEKETRTFLNLVQTNGSFRYPFIVKPGENSNRGNGIMIAQNESELLGAISANASGGNGRKPAQTLILQNYMTNPLLYKGRKFDIRCYALLVRAFDRLTFFWYNHGYARTSSYPYSNAGATNLLVHLTNEAVQVKSRTGLTRQTGLWEV